jgi:hypothetical protein
LASFQNLEDGGTEGLKGKGREEFMIHGKERNRVGTFDIISEGIYLACSA